MDAAKWKPNLKIKELRLHREARLNQWEGKAGLVWRVAQATKEEEVGKQDCYSLSQVINLTEQYTSHSNGKTLTATLPKGKWKLLPHGDIRPPDIPMPQREAEKDWNVISLTQNGTEAIR